MRILFGLYWQLIKGIRGSLWLLLSGTFLKEYPPEVCKRFIPEKIRIIHQGFQFIQRIGIGNHTLCFIPTGAYSQILMNLKISGNYPGKFLSYLLQDDELCNMNKH